MNGGLRELWQLPEVSRTQTSTQAEEFARAFRGGMAELNRTTQLAAAHAPPAEFKQLDAQRSQLYEAYQQVSAQIMPADPAKAGPGVKRVLSAVETLQGKMSELSTRVTEGREAWLKREGDFDNAVVKIGELEAAGHPKSPTLRKLSEAIRGKTNSGQFDQGVAAFDQFHAKLGDFITQDVAHAAPGGGGVAGNGSGKSTYEANVKSIQDDLDRVMNKTPVDKKTTLLREKVINVNAMMRAAVDDGDYVLANEYANELLQHLTDYQRAAQAATKERDKKSYETQVVRLSPAIDEAIKSQPADQAAAEIRGKIMAIRSQMELFANLQDYVAAKVEIDRIPPLLTQYKEANAQAAARKAYEGKIGRVKPELHKEMDIPPDDSKSAEFHKKLIDTGYEMEVAAARNDFVTANDRLSKIPALIEQYRKARQTHQHEVAEQSKAKSLYEAKFGRIQKELQRIVADKPIDATTNNLQQEILSLEDQIRFAIHQANYETANEFVDELTSLLDQYRTAKAKTENDPKYQYEQVRQPLEGSLKRALEPVRKEKFMADLQNKVKAAKTAMEEAAGKKDYVSARQQAVSLAALLKTFHEEDRKMPRDLVWVLATSSAMHKTITKMYNIAANKLDEIASAYDKALEEHKSALKTVKEKNSLLDAVLAGLFFAGLGGAVGGAVGNWLKSSMTKALADSGAGGALIDATKDVYKFAARIKPLLDSKSQAKEVAGLSVLSGNGSELVKQLSARIRNEQNKLLDVLIDLDHQVKNAAGKSPQIRLEGDPEESLDKDAFLKMLESAPAADKKGFAKVIWAAWVNEYAYKVKTWGETIYYSEQKLYYEVENDFDEDLIPYIQKQAGSDFNLYLELKKSEAKAFEKMKKMASAKPTGPETGKNTKYE